MRDYITLGSSPLDEDCAQVGTDEYQQRSRAELQQLKRMMQDIHPEIALGYYTVKAFPHEFGTYHELCAMFDDDYEATVNWAFEAEDTVPAKWDDQARIALAKYLEINNA